MEVHPEVQEIRQRLRHLLQGHASLREAFEMSEDDVLSLADLARRLAEQGELDDAQTLLEGLVVLDPRNSFLHTCLGVLYMQRSLPEAAMAHLSHALELNPRDVVAHTYLGELWLQQGNLTRAVPHLLQAIDLDPEGKDPYANRARALGALVLQAIEQVGGPEAEGLRQRLGSAASQE